MIWSAATGSYQNVPTPYGGDVSASPDWNTFLTNTYAKHGPGANATGKSEFDVDYHTFTVMVATTIVQGERFVPTGWANSPATVISKDFGAPIGKLADGTPTSIMTIISTQNGQAATIYAG